MKMIPSWDRKAFPEVCEGVAGHVYGYLKDGRLWNRKKSPRGTPWEVRFNYCPRCGRSLKSLSVKDQFIAQVQRNEWEALPLILLENRPPGILFARFRWRGTEQKATALVYDYLELGPRVEIAGTLHALTRTEYHGLYRLSEKAGV